MREKGTKAEEAVPEEQKERYKIWKTKDHKCVYEPFCYCCCLIVLKKHESN